MWILETIEAVFGTHRDDRVDRIARFYFDNDEVFESVLRRNCQ